MGDPASRERHVRFAGAQGFGGAREMDLPSADRIACDVPPRRAGKVSLLAWHTRRERSLSRRRQDLQAHRSAADPCEIVLVGDRVRPEQPQRDQDRPRQRCLAFVFELKDKAGSSVDLYFSPSTPQGHEGEWIKTISGKGWFAYFRIYGPEQPVFDGSWKPADFELMK
jgi:Protein of unknown function (DUF1214)